MLTFEDEQIEAEYVASHIANMKPYLLGFIVVS